jgi:tetratricopeptide (TPR) repeat protein
MYGNEKKCKKQIDIDNRFLEECDKEYASRQEACESMSRFGWKHYANGELDMAMKRFNQAWMLDSLNSDVYLGFAKVLADQDKLDESIPFFEKSIAKNPQNAEAYKSLGVTYGLLFEKSQENQINQEYLDKSVEEFKKAIAAKKDNAEAYALLTTAYTHYNQKDSAYKYLEITDKMNPDLISPDVRTQLKK